MQAIQALSAIAQATRLQVLTTLADVGEAGLSAGALAERVGAPASTMSAHLAILERAGLVSSTRSGRTIVFRLERDTVSELTGFLSHLFG